MRILMIACVLVLQDAPAVVKRALPDDAPIANGKRAVDVDRAQRILGSDVPSEITAYTAEGPHPNSNQSKPRWTATVVRIDTTHGPADLAVSGLLSENMVGRVRISGLQEKHVPSDFLRQFGGFEYETGSLSEPAATLDDVRTTAAAGKDEEAALLRALLAVRTGMSRITPLSLVIVDRIQKKQKKADEADALFKVYDEVSKSTDALTFLRADARKRLRDLAAASAGHARTIGDGIRSGNFAAADKAQQTLSSSCGACHGNFISVFRPERARRKLGDGYFRVGFDLIPQGDADPKLLEAIAGGVRRAMVMLRESR